MEEEARIYPLTTSIRYHIKVSANIIRQEREIKSINIGGKEIKLSLFGDNMIMDRKPKRINNNFQNPTTKFGKRI